MSEIEQGRVGLHHDLLHTAFSQVAIPRALPLVAALSCWERVEALSAVQNVAGVTLVL